MISKKISAIITISLITISIYFGSSMLIDNSST